VIIISTSVNPHERCRFHAGFSKLDVPIAEVSITSEVVIEVVIEVVAIAICDPHPASSSSRRKSPRDVPQEADRGGRSLNQRHGHS
jgi:hypothetical protein